MNRRANKKALKKKNSKSEDGKNLSTKAKIEWLQNTVEKQQKMLAEHRGHIYELTLLVGLLINPDDPEGALREYAPKIDAWAKAHTSPKTDIKQG